MKVLVVEGRLLLRQLFLMVFERAGYRVVVTASSQEGFDIFRETHFDVVVTEWNLPGGTCQNMIMKMLAQRPELPVLILSGSFPTIPEGWAFLQKPFLPSELIARVTKLAA